jgi:hypothetical protein
MTERGLQTRRPVAETGDADGDAREGAVSGWRRWWKVLGPGVVTGAADDMSPLLARFDLSTLLRGPLG